MAVLPTPMISTRDPTESDVAEVDRLEPLDAEEDLIGVVAAGNLELFALGRTAADEHRVELAAIEQPLEALDRRVVTHVHAHVDDVADLFVEDFLGQAERRNVDAHQPAGPRQLLEDGDLIAERHQIVRDGERRRAGADERDLLAVLLRCALRDPGGDVTLLISGDALQPADRDRLSVHTRPPARRLARPIAGPPENAGKDVRFPVQDVGIRVPPWAMSRMYSGTLVCAGHAH
jgi:hypothetical protein